MVRPARLRFALPASPPGRLTGVMAADDPPQLPSAHGPSRVAVWASLHRGAVVTVLTLAVTTGLWVIGKIVTGLPGPIVWQAAYDLSLLWALNLTALTLLAGSPARGLDPWFGGLDRAIALHRVIGPSSVALLLLHVAFAIPIWMVQAGPLLFDSPGSAAFWGLALAAMVFAALTYLSYRRKLRNRTWKLLHRLYGPLFLVVAYPSLFLVASIATFEPLRLWMALLVFIGTGALVRRWFFFRHFGSHYRYAVDRMVDRGGGAYDLILKPTTTRMPYAPGNFVFVSIPGHPQIANDMHLFSVSSSPATRGLRLSVRAAGAFSSAMRELSPGWPVDVFGPFGGLSTHALLDRKEIICAGAGMGISPFLAMLSFGTTDDDPRRIHLFYIVADRSAAFYDEEINALCAASHDRVSYELWDHSRVGRFTAVEGLRRAAFAAQPAELGVMLCGPAGFVADLTRQFRTLGVQRDHILGEGFRLR
ncbi:MAG: ferredoxin reductase family protein [Pseudomonadota bacterium]